MTTDWMNHYTHNEYLTPRDLDHVEPAEPITITAEQAHMVSRIAALNAIMRKHRKHPLEVLEEALQERTHLVTLLRHQINIPRDLAAYLSLQRGLTIDRATRWVRRQNVIPTPQPVNA